MGGDSRSEVWLKLHEAALRKCARILLLAQANTGESCPPAFMMAGYSSSGDFDL
jgi:hypothetical protein